MRKFEGFSSLTYWEFKVVQIHTTLVGELGEFAQKTFKSIIYIWKEVVNCFISVVLKNKFRLFNSQVQLRFSDPSRCIVNRKSFLAFKSGNSFPALRYQKFLHRFNFFGFYNNGFRYFFKCTQLPRSIFFSLPK